MFLFASLFMVNTAEAQNYRRGNFNSFRYSNFRYNNFSYSYPVTFAPSYSYSYVPFQIAVAPQLTYVAPTYTAPAPVQYTAPAPITYSAPVVEVQAPVYAAPVYSVPVYTAPYYNSVYRYNQFHHHNGRRR